MKTAQWSWLLGYSGAIDGLNGISASQSGGLWTGPSVCAWTNLCMFILSCTIVMLAEIAIRAKLLMHRSFASYLKCTRFPGRKHRIARRAVMS